MVINWLKPPWTKKPRQKECHQVLDILILANICFFHLVAWALIQENDTSMPNDEYVLKSLWLLSFQVSQAISPPEPGMLKDFFMETT